MSTPSQPAHGEALTEAEVVAIDDWMNAHMRGHQISNNVNGMSCDIDCRQRAVKTAVDRVLRDRLAAQPAPHDCATCLDCIHNGNKCCGCYDGVCCQEAAQPAHGDNEAALRALREASSEWASEYDRLTREQPHERKTRAAYRLASVLAGQRADALAALSASAEPEGGEGCG